MEMMLHTDSKALELTVEVKNFLFVDPLYNPMYIYDPKGMVIFYGFELTHISLTSI